MKTLKKILKALLPSYLRLQIRLFNVSFLDFISGNRKMFVERNKNKLTTRYGCVAQVSQPVKETEFSANKVANILLALEQINYLAIHPNRIFSFWHLVGGPSAQNGFKQGRSIVGSRLSADFGGGLCQLSGMIYLLALKTNMKIIERHAHSHDLYNEETRYTPLGSDATVAYGYKDLRFQNNTNSTIYFQFNYTNNQMVGEIHSQKPIPAFDLDFKTELTETVKIARSYRLQPGQDPVLLAKTEYKHYEYEVKEL